MPLRAETCGAIADEDGPPEHRIPSVRYSEFHPKYPGETLLVAPTVPTSVLTEAERAVNGDRQTDYDHPVRNFALIAQDWRAWIYARHGIVVPIDGMDVAYMNIGQKRCREAHRRKRDNRVDTCGYMRALQLGEESALRQLQGQEVPETEQVSPDLLQYWEYLLQE